MVGVLYLVVIELFIFCCEGLLFLMHINDSVCGNM